ncbi:hypothetical protein EYF80_051340 [Liparis tanakae]|uniref:Uncharacterized protein n=1 Tax=Liparis tanakae TaxID=230148 RepID=A0A4Z2FB81_9TELE|nr:hypothetical protein EYF80_051340 [Liparis tanakae]
MGAKPTIYCSPLWSEYDDMALRLYEFALEQPCLLPDVDIDPSLLKYSGLDSNAMLRSYSNELIDKVPGYVDRLGSGLGSMTSFPNAVGLGALVLSIIMELFMKSSTGAADDSANLFRRVFAEEKASGVRDTMSEYVKRHEMHMKDQRLLQMEIQRLETQLSNHLTVLKNSLLHDGQMGSRGFKIWVNGASFHLQMLIHEARLNSQTCIRATDSVHIIGATINAYSRDLDHMLKAYRAHLTSTTRIHFNLNCLGYGCYEHLTTCYIENNVKNCNRHEKNFNPRSYCYSPCVMEPFMNNVFSKYEGLKSHFVNIKDNLNLHINQHDSLTLASARKVPGIRSRLYG